MVCAIFVIGVDTSLKLKVNHKPVNAYERLINTLRGDSIDRPANFNIMMQFAAHHVEQPLNRYYLDYRVLCEANMAVLNDFSVDIVQAISDPYREAADFGLQVEFPEDGLPISHRPLIAEPGDLKQLVSPDPAMGKRMSDRLEAIRFFRDQVGGEVPIMGWVEGALAEAADLRGVNNLMLDVVDRPDWVMELLEICVEVEIAFAKAQIEAGADIIGLGDAVASQVSPRMYKRFALPYEKRIFAAVHEMGALARLHICGDTSRILTPMVETGADMIDIDWMVDMQLAVVAFGEVVVVGNTDPVAVMLHGTPEQVYDKTLACMQDGGKYFISAAGCEIPDGTPHENLHAQSRALWH